MSVSVPGGGCKPRDGARVLGLAVHVLNTDEEQLIAEAKLQVLKQWR